MALMRAAVFCLFLWWATPRRQRRLSHFDKLLSQMRKELNDPRSYLATATTVIPSRARSARSSRTASRAISVARASK